MISGSAGKKLQEVVETFGIDNTVEQLALICADKAENISGSMAAQHRWWWHSWADVLKALVRMKR